MADVTGPISTLPGTSHSFPKGTMCDSHPERPAVARIQGETDSFGSEMNDMCQACLDAHRTAMKAWRERTAMCDWCKCEANDLRDFRDIDEGMAGPVYQVCSSCRQKAYEAIEEELKESDAEFDFGDYDDYDGDDDYGIDNIPDEEE